jgi:hypothetical protein
MGVVSVTPRPRFTPWKVPIGQEAGWAPEPVWTQRLEEKSLASAGDQTYYAMCNLICVMNRFEKNGSISTPEK